MPQPPSAIDAKIRNHVCAEFLASKFYLDSDFTILLSDTQINEGLHHDFRRSGVDEDQIGMLEGAGRTCAVDHPWYLYCADRAGVRNDEGAPRTSFEFQETFCGSEARLQMSRAFGDGAWTVSVRWDYKKGCDHPHAPQIVDADDYVERAKDSLRQSRWFPSLSYFPPQSPFPVLFSVADIVECLYTLIAEEETPKHGLMLVTGRTGSLKSEAARGLVCKWLESQIPHRPGGRRPHLVTFEDPIEKVFLDFKEDASSPILTLADKDRCFDYTPRQRLKDCQDLQEVLDGALRQTPTIVYVGEIREERDLARVLEFAGTGHLALATAHAGHLVESVSKVLNAVRASDPGSRAIYVPRILAVVHMDRLTALVPRANGSSTGAGSDGSTERFAGVVPTLYRRTSTGMQSLIADGLFSLMPNFSGDGESARQHGSLGRQAIAQMLCEVVTRRFARHGRQEMLLPQDSEWPKDDEWLGSEWTEAIPAWNCNRLGLLDRAMKQRTGGKRVVDAALEKDLHGQ